MKIVSIFAALSFAAFAHANPTTTTPTTAATPTSAPEPKVAANAPEKTHKDAHAKKHGKMMKNKKDQKPMGHDTHSTDHDTHSTDEHKTH